MKFREIFRFELVYQARRVRTWLYFVVLFVVAYGLKRIAGGGDAPGVSSFDMAQDTILTGLLWIWMAPAVAGTAAARDVQTRMHPLLYTAPIRKADYLGGRFLAAFVLNALLLLAVPLGSLAALYLPGREPEFVGALNSTVYLSSYGVLALPTAFAFTAVQFSVAALKRRAILSYLGNVLFLVVSTGAALGLNVLNMPTLGKLLDPTCRINVLVILADTLTPLEKNTLLIGLESSILANRPCGSHSLRPYSCSSMSAFDSIAGQRDAQDFRSPGPAEVRLRHPRAADVRHRRDFVWDDREECGRSRCYGGRDACGPVDACARGSSGNCAAPQNRERPDHSDRPGC